MREGGLASYLEVAKRNVPLCVAAAASRGQLAGVRLRANLSRPALPVAVLLIGIFLLRTVLIGKPAFTNNSIRVSQEPT